MAKWQSSLEGMEMIMGDRKFWKNKQVLITGYQGFLGSWLTKGLFELGAKITGIDIMRTNENGLIKGISAKIKNIRADLAEFKVVEDLIKKYKPEIIFHLAAQAIVGEAVNAPLRTFRSNIEGTWNILEACRGRKFVEAIVVASSDKAYGSQKNLPYKEDMPLQGKYPYDVSKSCADLLAYSYFRTYHLPVCVTRCGNIFGPGDLHFSRLVPDALRCIIKNKPFIIRSDGKFTRDYIFVEDVARGYILLAQKLKRLHLYGEAFNFSNEKPLTVLELFQKMVKVSGDYNLSPAILNKAKYEIRHQYLSSEKARKILGWRPRHNLESNLRLTLDWYRDFLRKK